MIPNTFKHIDYFLVGCHQCRTIRNITLRFLCKAHYKKQKSKNYLASVSCHYPPVWFVFAIVFCSNNSPPTQRLAVTCVRRVLCRARRRCLPWLVFCDVDVCAGRGARAGMWCRCAGAARASQGQGALVSYPTVGSIPFLDHVGRSRHVQMKARFAALLR